MNRTSILIAVFGLLVGVGLSGCHLSRPCEDSPCPSQDKDGDGFWGDGQDCDDEDPAIYPGATETCNQKDDDCDEKIDEGVTSSFFLDSDGDGYGDPDATTQACEAPDGAVAVGDDCDDKNAEVHPDADETCETEGSAPLDNDCDGWVDDEDPDLVGAPTWYIDYDGDTHGSSALASTACVAPPGYVETADDCDETNPVAYPGASEVCDAADNDCDTEVDEGVTTTFYIDADGDGHCGDSTVEACGQSEGLCLVDGDCDDEDSAAYPGADEVCDAEGSAPLDNDCDGEVDEGLETFPVYPDLDGDGFGAGEVTSSCRLAKGQSRIEGDCDDTRPDVNPMAAEACDEIDNDCDEEIDEVCFGTATYGKSRWSKRPEVVDGD